MSDIDYSTPFQLCSKDFLNELLPFPLVNLYQALGLDEQQAQAAAESIIAIRISSDLLKAMLLAQSVEDINDLQQWFGYLAEVVRPYAIRPYTLNDVLVANIAPKSSSELTQVEAERFGQYLGLHFPKQIPGFIYQIKSEDGTICRLRTWDSKLIESVNDYLSQFVQWFNNNKERLSPQFAEIKEEIGGYLKNNYGGVSPNSNGFVQWFIANKLRSVIVEFELRPIPSLGENEYEILGFKANQLNTEQLPFILERDVHEYCDWKFQQQQLIKQQVKHVVGKRGIVGYSPKEVGWAEERVLMDPEEARQIIRNILNPLSGINPQQILIMSSEDFKRLLAFTEHLIFTDTLPNVESPIKRVNISSEHIRYTYYRLHKALFTTKKIDPKFFSFLKLVFTLFKEQEIETLRRKFATPPKSYSRDFNISL